MIVFHTDLDNTLIYSYKHELGADKRCVEVYHGREISFITAETERLLQQIKARENQIVMIPTTTRTTEQYHRIQLGIGELPYALVCNGGVLLVRGREDEDWYHGSLERIRDSREMLHLALALLEKDPRRSFELRFIRDLFVFTKCQEPEAVVCELRQKLDRKVVEVFQNGVKVYVVPKALSKGSAVQRFREYSGAAYTIAAGDSEFDCSMLEEADVKPIEAVGKEFDPNLHNAVMQTESEEYESGIVAQELQKGYTYRDSVVRHSMVAVVS